MASKENKAIIKKVNNLYKIDSCYIVIQLELFFYPHAMAIYLGHDNWKKEKQKTASKKTI